MTPKPLEIITGNVLMQKMFGDGRDVVLHHTFAEWQAQRARRDYCPFPRFSLPTEPRPTITIFAALGGKL